MKFVLLDFLPNDLTKLDNCDFRFFGERQWFCDHIADTRTTYSTHDTDIDVLKKHYTSIVYDLTQNGYGGHRCMAIAGSESGVEPAAMLHNELGIRALNLSQCQYFRNKYKMFELAQKVNELPVIPTFTLAKFRENTCAKNVFNSYVLKPIDGCASEGIKYIEPNALAHFLADTSLDGTRYIIQQEIRGNVLHIDGVWKGFYL